jgi:hypothetical protein
MPLVLAIQPDRRQAAQLAALVRQQVRAELVLADTTEGALDAIGNRVPDLVLVPALLSPQDDAALAAALRVIAAAAHVRTLTIPVLANGTKREASGGMLAKWRRKSAESPEPDGCEPSVFAEQISAYLLEAAAERAELEDTFLQDEAIAVTPPIAVAATVQPTTNDQRPTTTKAIAVEAPEPPPLDDMMPAAPRQQPWADTMEPWAAAPMAPPAARYAAEDAADPADEPLIDLSDELAEMSEEDGPREDTDGELFDGERVGVYTIAAEAADLPLESFDLLSAILEPAAAGATPSAAAAPSAIAQPVAVEAPDYRPAPIAATSADAPAALLAEPPAASFVEPPAVSFVESPAATFVEPPESPRADIEPWVPMYLTPGRLWPTLEGVPAEMPVARAEQPDWIELVASLRQDLERRRTEPAAAMLDPIAARPSDGVSAEAHRLAKKPRVHIKAAKPIQDEWGFFDPEQCGFSTLLAKLEEITDDEART